VLLVDDESEVIDAIERKINWSELGFEVIGEAYNGVKALELAEKRQPDVVITDIKMPYMNGLELSKKLNNDFPNIHIIIFTGFDEFEYAKEAVHLEIEEYMLKPINSGELSDCLRRLKDTLDKERDEKLNIKKLESYFNDSLPMLQMNFFVSLIEGRIKEAEVSKYISDYKIGLKGPFYCLAIFHTSEHHVPEGMNSLLLAMSVQREIKDRVKDKWSGETFNYLGNTVVIFELEKEEDITPLTDDLDRFCRWAQRVMGAVVTVGVGKCFKNIVEANASYEGAREAVSYRVLFGTTRAINIVEIAPNEQESAATADEMGIHELFKTIRLGQREEVIEAVNSEIDKIRRNAKTVNQYKLAIMEIIGAFYRFCANNVLDFNDYKGDIDNPYEIVPQMDEDTLRTWMTDIATKLSENVKNTRNTTSKRMIMDAQNIVKERYQDPDLSLDIVCSLLGVSNSYFSSIFKKEVGKSFVTYLTDYRMENAARLIIETNEKSYEIASKVGYLDANYFSYVFKKTYGVSPSKFRNDNTD